MRLLGILAAAWFLLLVPLPATACIGVPAPHRFSVLDVTTGAEQELPEIVLGGPCGFEPPPFAMDGDHIVWEGNDGSIVLYDRATGTMRAIGLAADPHVIALPSGRPHYGGWSGDVSLSGNHAFILGVDNGVTRVSLETGERTRLAWPFPPLNGTFALAGPILWAAEHGPDGHHRYVHAYDLDAQRMLLARSEVTATDGVSAYVHWYPEAFLETGIVVIPVGVYGAMQTYLELVDGGLLHHRFASPFIRDAQDASAYLYGTRAAPAASAHELVRWRIPPAQAEPVVLPAGLGTMGPLLAADGDQLVLMLWNATGSDAAPASTSLPPAGSGVANPVPAWPAALAVALLAVLAAARRRD